MLGDICWCLGAIALKIALTLTPVDEAALIEKSVKHTRTSHIHGMNHEDMIARALAFTGKVNRRPLLAPVRDVISRVTKTVSSRVTSARRTVRSTRATHTTAAFKAEDSEFAVRSASLPKRKSRLFSGMSVSFGEKSERV